MSLQGVFSTSSLQHLTQMHCMSLVSQGTLTSSKEKAVSSCLCWRCLHIEPQEGSGQAGFSKQLPTFLLPVRHLLLVVSSIMSQDLLSADNMLLRCVATGFLLSFWLPAPLPLTERERAAIVLGHPTISTCLNSYTNTHTLALRPPHCSQLSTMGLSHLCP